MVVDDGRVRLGGRQNDKRHRVHGKYWHTLSDSKSPVSPIADSAGRESAVPTVVILCGLDITEPPGSVDQDFLVEPQGVNDTAPTEY